MTTLIDDLLQLSRVLRAEVHLEPTDLGAEVTRIVREKPTSGRVLGIEVKAGATVRTEDLSGLRGLANALGDRFIGRVVPDSAANTDLAPFFERHVTTPHSVVTAHLIDEVGQPTIAARDEILAFFRRRLAPV